MRCERAAAKSDSFYAFQCALALSVLADQSMNPLQLREAYDKYNTGLQHDPYWPVHIANRAAIEFDLGNEQEAIRGMSTALDQAPRNAPFALNLGRMYELLGKSDAARSSYIHAVALDPWIYRSSFMNLTDLRRGVLQEVEIVSFRNEVEALTWQGWRLLDQGRNGSATEAFNEVLDLNPTVGEAHAGLAVALHRSQLDPDSIEKELQLAVFYAPGSYLVQELGWMDRPARSTT